MKLIRFRRLYQNYWEIAVNEEHLRLKLNGDMAEVIMPAKPWYVRLWRIFRPLKVKAVIFQPEKQWPRE